MTWMKRGIRTLAVALLSAILLSGCGENQIPELTEEQMKAVGEFAAFYLMKYDANNRSRLVDLEQYEKKQAASALEQKEEKAPGMGPVEETPVIDEIPDMDEQPKEEVLSVDMGERLELPEQIEITYEDASLWMVYPEEGNDLISIVAKEGSQILALRFHMKNTSDTEQAVDIFGKQLRFSVSIDGGRSSNCLTTLLPNDLSTLRQRLGAGEMLELVLLAEIPDSEYGINRIDLQIRGEYENYTVHLQD